MLESQLSDNVHNIVAVRAVVAQWAELSKKIYGIKLIQ